MIIDLSVVESWCQDALRLLGVNDLPDSIFDLRANLILQHAGTRRLYWIADDLAQGISDLPAIKKSEIDDFLKKKYGFGSEFFTEVKMKKLLRIVSRGKIISDAECEFVNAVVHDVAIQDAIRFSAEALLAGYADYKRSQKKPHGKN